VVEKKCEAKKSAVVETETAEVQQVARTRTNMVTRRRSSVGDPNHMNITSDFTGGNAAAVDGGGQASASLPPGPPLTPSEFYHGRGGNPFTPQPQQQQSGRSASTRNRGTSPFQQHSRNISRPRSTNNRTTQTIYAAPSWARQQSQSHLQAQQSPLHQRQSQQSILQPSGLAIPMSALSLQPQQYGKKASATPPALQLQSSVGSAATNGTPSPTRFVSLDNAMPSATTSAAKSISTPATKPNPSSAEITATTSNGPKVDLPNNTKRHRRNNSHDEFINNLMSLDHSSRHSNSGSNNKLHSSGPIQFEHNAMMNSSASSFSTTFHNNNNSNNALSSSIHSEKNFQTATNFKSYMKSPGSSKPKIAMSSSKHRRMQQTKRATRKKNMQQQLPHSSSTTATTPYRSTSVHGTTTIGTRGIQLPTATSSSSSISVGGGGATNTNGTSPSWDRWSSENRSLHQRKNPLRSASWEGQLVSSSTIGHHHDGSSSNANTPTSSAPVIGLIQHQHQHHNGISSPPSSDLDSDIEIDFDTIITTSNNNNNDNMITNNDGDDDIHDDDDDDSFANERRTPVNNIIVTKWDSSGWDNAATTTTSPTIMNSPHLVDRRKGRSTNTTNTNYYTSSSNNHHYNNNNTNINSNGSGGSSSNNNNKRVDDNIGGIGYDDIECGGTTVAPYLSPITHTFMSNRARRRRRRQQQKLHQQANYASSSWTPRQMEYYKQCIKRFPCVRAILFPSASMLWQLLVLLVFGCAIHLNASHRIAVAHEELHATHVEKSQILQQMEWMERKAKQQHNIYQNDPQRRKRQEQDESNENRRHPYYPMDPKDVLLNPQLWDSVKDDGDKSNNNEQQKQKRSIPRDPSAFDSVYAALFGTDDATTNDNDEDEDQKSDIMLTDARLSANKISKKSEPSMRYQRDELLMEVNSLQTTLCDFAKERLNELSSNSIQLQLKSKNDTMSSFDITMNLDVMNYPYTSWIMVHQFQQHLWDDAELSISKSTVSLVVGDENENEEQPQPRQRYREIKNYNIQPSPSKYDQNFKLHWFEVAQNMDDQKAPLSTKRWTVGLRRNLIPRKQLQRERQNAADVDINNNDDASPDENFPDMVKSFPYLVFHTDDDDECGKTSPDVLEICFGYITGGNLEDLDGGNDYIIESVEVLKD